MFAGYDRYLCLKIDAMYQRVPSFIRQPVILPIAYRLPKTEKNANWQLESRVLFTRRVDPTDTRAGSGYSSLKRKSQRTLLIFRTRFFRFLLSSIRGWRHLANLKKAFSDVIPKEILNRPKEWFGVPLARWLRNELRQMTEDLLMTHSTNVPAVIRREHIESIVPKHMNGQANQAVRIWALLRLGAWRLAFKTRL